MSEETKMLESAIKRYQKFAKEVSKNAEEVKREKVT